MALLEVKAGAWLQYCVVLMVHRQAGAVACMAPWFAVLLASAGREEGAWCGGLGPHAHTCRAALGSQAVVTNCP